MCIILSAYYELSFVMIDRLTSFASYDFEYYIIIFVNNFKKPL